MVFYSAILDDFINDGIAVLRNYVDFLLLELWFTSKGLD